MEGNQNMYVAISHDAEEDWSMMKWALQNSGGKKVCTLYVHLTPLNIYESENEKSFREKEREEVLDEYLGGPQIFGGGIEKLYIMADSIEKGIIQLVEQHNITELVIGAAADKYYSRTMTVRSKKAIYVMDNAPLSCCISFVCNGHLIHTSGCRGAIKPPSERDGGAGSSTVPCDLYSSAREYAGGCLSQSSLKQESSTNNHLYDDLKLIIEAENSRRVAFDESIRRQKADKEALSDAIRKAETFERLFSKEVLLRKATEEKLALSKKEVAIGKEELDFVNELWNKVSNELREAMVQKFSLENKIETLNLSLKESENKLTLAMEMLQEYKNGHEKLQMEKNDALKEAEELRKQLYQGPSSSNVAGLISAFSTSDLKKATNYFDSGLKIGEGGYGSIYKGFLCHTEVAIKTLNPHSTQGPREFDQEVNVLSRLRHPNLVTLIGACQDFKALVYEYLPGGNLEDRLSCKNNAPPLLWQTRIRIATELCSALVFLHSSRPGCIIHGDLKPSNILLDGNCVCKLSDFGICRVVLDSKNSMNQSTLICDTQPKGTCMYMDPVFLSTGELTPQSDVYSFGIILLRLLTGKSALGIAKQVEDGLRKGNLYSMLDTSAGDWSFVQAQQLVHVALRCCDINRKNRPNLESDVWKVLEPMKVSCQSSSMLPLATDNQVPNYFICPVTHEIMKDPQIASDGFTYEAKAIRNWLNSGHDSSPMTNMTLAHHNLTPNRALRSAIQEWLQHNRCE